MVATMMHLSIARLKNKDVFVIFVIVRLASVFLVQTSFVPDEYWQSLEVAHRITFGYGYLTWEWIHGIRSYVYPLIFTVLYKILDFCSLDTPEILIYLPRVLQALLSAYADYCFYKWTFKRRWALFCMASAWFWFFTASRTIINTFETALTTIALSKYPWIGRGKSDSKSFIALASVVCVIRPTAAILWVPITLFHLATSKDNRTTLVLREYLPIGLVILLTSILFDSLAHGSFIVTSYEFLKVNLFEGIGYHYGTHPWHWYLSQGFPAILGIFFIPFVLAVIKILKQHRNFPNEIALLSCIACTLIIYSCLPHKEFRFILPLLPICLHLTASYLSMWSSKANNILVWVVASVLLLGNLIPAWYFSIIHQRGTLDVMESLRNITNAHPNRTNLLFLTPCHSTPLYSHLHVNVTTKFLTCEPNFNQTAGYVDEADMFFNNSNHWLTQNYSSNTTLPTHVIFFDTILPYISTILKRYKPIQKFFHTSLPEGRIGKYIWLYQRVDLEKQMNVY